MADTNKVSLAHLKMAMNTIKEYHDQNGANFSLAYDSSTGVLKLMHGDQEISSVTISSPASSSIPCTGITLSTNSLSFTSTAAQTITATKQPSNTTDVVTWSVTPADIATVNNGVVTPIANGSCTITATCGSHSATCAVTVEVTSEPPEEGSLTISNITAGTFTTSDTVTITYTTSKAVTTHYFIMNYTGSDSGFTDGTVRVTSSGNNHTMTFNAGELVAGTKNGAIKVTDASGNTTIARFTLVITDGTVTTYTITNNLTNCTSNNSNSTVTASSSYSATISAESGYELSSLTVTMGGADITSSAVSGSTISISNVTGDIVITANATIAATSNALYELKAAKTFNGTSDYLDTGVTLLTGDNLNKDWTMLIDFTPTSLTQASIIHCMTEASPWPGMYLSLTATGGIQMVFPNNSTKNNIVTVAANQRIKFVIKKVGTTFTIYNSSMSSLHSNNPGTITTTSNTLLLGAIQVYSATAGKTTYSRFFKGTIHRFKIVEGDMSREDCLAWIG